MLVMKFNTFLEAQIYMDGEKLPTSTFTCISALIIFIELLLESATYCPEVCVSLLSDKGLTVFLRKEKLVFSACPNPTS